MVVATFELGRSLTIVPILIGCRSSTTTAASGAEGTEASPFKACRDTWSGGSCGLLLVKPKAPSQPYQVLDSFEYPRARCISPQHYADASVAVDTEVAVGVCLIGDVALWCFMCG
jgi:hypothetical protein